MGGTLTSRREKAPRSTPVSVITATLKNLCHKVPFGGGGSHHMWFVKRRGSKAAQSNDMGQGCSRGGRDAVVSPRRHPEAAAPVAGAGEEAESAAAEKQAAPRTSHASKRRGSVRRQFILLCSVAFVFQHGGARPTEATGCHAGLR